MKTATLPTPSSLKHSILAHSVGWAVALFILYAWGACRTIYVGDSGELVTAAAILGIPHPSGYPLYVLLGNLWIHLLPVGSVAFRMSLFSAFFAALTCSLLYWVARRQHLGPWAASLGCALLALSPSFWSQANIQRVYSLNAFFVIALLGCALEWYRGRDIRWMIGAAFMAGLGACNHTVLGVLGVAVGLVAVAVHPSLLRRPLHLLACIGAGLAGLLPYAYLPWRSKQDPPLDWGDPETLQGFLDVVLRKDFWHRAWAEGPADYLTIAADYLLGIGQETLWIGAALAVVGILGWRRRVLLLPIAIMLANAWAVGVHGSRSDIFIWHRYYIPSYVMVALLAAFGYQWLEELWEGRRLGPWLRAAWIAPLALLLIGWPRFDRSDFTIAEEFSRTVLADLPPGARLAASDDNILFVLIYLQFVERVRPDVDLILQGVGGADLPNVRFDPDTDPLFFTHHPNWNIQELDIMPVGLVFRTVRQGSPDPPRWLDKTELEGAWDPAVPKDYLTNNLIGHFHYMRALSFETRDWPKAQEEFQRAAQAAADNDVLFYNLGLIYRRNGLLRRAVTAFEYSTEINPRHIPSANPTRPVDKLVQARQELEELETMEAPLRRSLGLPDAAADGGSELDAAQHRRLAEALDGMHQSLAARGHRLLAEELESGLWLPSTQLEKPTS